MYKDITISICIMNIVEEIKINRILRDMAREKIEKELQNINTDDLIEELQNRLKTSIYAFCELCNIEGEDFCHFLLIEHSEIDSESGTLFCKKHTIKK
jgi:hypothetical protein